MGSVFSVKRKVRFADCDPAGIAYYPRLVEHVNGVVEDWFDGPLGYSFRDMHETQGRGIPTVSLKVDFLRPAELGDVLEWHLAVKQLNRSSLVLSLVARHPDGGDVMRAEPTLVHTNFDSHPPKSDAFPEYLRAKIESYRGE
jgi:4-hydroxybenzoyl-CoA thioesterase